MISFLLQAVILIWLLATAVCFFFDPTGTAHWFGLVIHSFEIGVHGQ